MAADVVVLQHACSEAYRQSLDPGVPGGTYNLFKASFLAQTHTYVLYTCFAQGDGLPICHTPEVSRRSLAEPRNGIEWLLHRAHKVPPLRSSLTTIEDVNVEGNSSCLENPRIRLFLTCFSKTCKHVLPIVPMRRIKTAVFDFVI